MNNTKLEKLLEEKKCFQTGRTIFFGACMMFFALVFLCSWVKFFGWGNTPEWIRTAQAFGMLGFGLLAALRATKISDDLRGANRELEM